MTHALARALKRRSQYQRGDQLTQQAMMTLPLTDQERTVLASAPVRAVSARGMQQFQPVDLPMLTALNDDIPYDILGFTTPSPLRVFVREDLPVVPRLSLPNIAGLSAWETEREILPHEFGHVRDYALRGRTTEPSAIAFQRAILDRTDPTAMRRSDIVRSLRSTLNPPRAVAYQFLRPTRGVIGRLARSNDEEG